MADEPKKPSASETGKPETTSRVQQIAQTLKESRAERLRRRDELAYSPAVLGENVTKVMGARIATNVERELTDVFGSKIGASIREARRAEPGKKLSTFGRMYLSQLTTSIGGMGIIGEGIANRLRDQRKFDDDPQKEFEKIKGNFIAVSDDLRKTQFNFEKLKKSQEEIAKEVTKTTNLITDLNNTATRLERDFKEFQEVNFRQFKENVERRLSTLEGMAEMRSAPGGAGQQMKTGRGGTSTAGGPSLTDLAITAAGTAAAAGGVAARALSYAKTAGKFALKRSPYLIAGYGLYKGIETIGQANEARDRELGIDRNDPRMLTPEGQAEIEQRRREYHGRRKRGVNEEYRAQLEEAKRQSSAPKPTSQKRGLFDLGGFTSSSIQQYAQRFNKESSFGESFDRQMIEREKSQFLQFGQLPRGFEFLPGQMGRLGSPEAVAARGVMPLGGYGGVAGVPGMPSGGYATGGGNAAGYTTGPTANVGREGTYAGGRSDPAVNIPLSGKLGEDRRARFENELKDNPQLMTRLYNLARTEVGANPRNQQLFLETVFNRAMFSNKPISSIVSSIGPGQYYPGIKSFNPSSSEMENFRNSVVGDIMKGSNRTSLATDNASNQAGNEVANKRIRAGATGAWLGEGQLNVSREYYYFGGSGAGKYRTAHGVRAEKYRSELEKTEGRVSTPGTQTQSQSTPGTSAPTPAKPETQTPATAPAKPETQKPGVTPASGAPQQQATGVTAVPGIVPKQTQQQQLMPGVSLSPVQTELLPGLAKQQPGKVEEAQQTEAAHRKLPISEQLKKQLAYAASEAGVEVKIASGGQDPRIPGTTPAGASTRHNYGNAADLDLYVVENGKRRILDMRNPADAEIMEKFARAAVRAGATGIGAGIGYMGAHRMHIGGGPVASWGARGGSPPAWITRAHSQGMKEQSSFNLEEWIKKNKGPIKVEAAPELSPENEKRLREIYERETGKKAFRQGLAGAATPTSDEYREWRRRNEEAYARVLEQPQLAGTNITGRVPESTLPTQTAIPQFTQPTKQLDPRFKGLPEGQQVTPTEQPPQITPMQPDVKPTPAAAPVPPSEPVGGAFASIPSSLTPGSVSSQPSGASTQPPPSAAPYAPPSGLGTGVRVQQMEPPPQTLPTPAAPLPQGSAVGGVLGGMRPSEAAPQQPLPEGERAYREAISPPPATTPGEQYAGPKTPQEGTGRSGSSGSSTGAGNGRNNPESAQPSPGSGGSGSYGRCFL